MKKPKNLFCGLLLTMSAANFVMAQENASSLPDIIPYVSTPQVVVDEMLKMAQVNGSDVLYDLGSGDGRIPITAARHYGVRAVGIDINPDLVKEANENAIKAKVMDKVTFFKGDLFEMDFNEATVLTLYLFPDVNMKLRPKILQMKPGTRVVSHKYGMEGWEPEQTKKIKVPNGAEHVIYLWRVPSDNKEVE